MWTLTRTSVIVMVMMGLSGGVSSVFPLFSIYSIAWDDDDDDNLAHVSSPPFIQSMLRIHFLVGSQTSFTLVGWSGQQL